MIRQLNNNNMIEDNKINQRESSISKSNQRFIDFLHSLRKQRKERLVPICPMEVEKLNSCSESKNLPETNISEVIQVPSYIEQTKPLISNPTKFQQESANKQMGDNALKYKARVNMHYKAFFQPYQFSPNWFMQTQKQLDEYLRSSRVIPERQVRENKSLNLSRLGKKGQRQLGENHQDRQMAERQIQKNKVGRQKQWIIKTARERRQGQRYEEQEEANVEQDSHVKNFRVQRDVKSQYFQLNNKKLNKGNFELDPFQSREVYHRRSKEKSNQLQHCRQFSYPFAEQTPLFSESNETSKRRIQRRQQPRKSHLKPIGRQIAEQLFQEQPLRSKC